MNLIPYMKRILILILGLSSLIVSASSHQEKESSKELPPYSSSERKIENVIKGYFDKQEWHYRMYTDEDSIITFRLGFYGDNEKLMLQVNVLPNNDIYQISCRSDTKLPQNIISNGIIAMNDYNLRANVVSGCISPEGNIIFWLGRNTDGNTFSEQAFSIDCDMVIKEADDETAQIYKQAYNPKSLCQTFPK